MNLYFIAIVPSPPLSRRIRELKLELAEKYKTKHALKLPAHLTLAIPFRISSTREEKLQHTLEHFAGKQETFTIEASGFDRFSQKVLFINITENPVLFELRKQLHKCLERDLGLKRNLKEHHFHPHITLATRDLNKVNFEEAWKALKDRRFQDSFAAKSLVLFRHTGSLWESIGEFSFKKIH
ncbi:2'-5' RNA ligase family protein [Salegentibacter sp. F14]